MPTVSINRIRRVGKPNVPKKDKSGVLTLPIDYVRYLEKITGESNPAVEIWGNSILIVKPMNLRFDDSVKKGVIKLLEDIQKTEELKELKQDE